MAWHNRIFGGLFGSNGHAKTKAIPRRERSIGKPQTTQSARNTPRANSWPELAVEIEKDPAFQLGSLAIKALIQTTEVAIEGAGEDQRAVALAENLKTRWYDILPHLLSSFGNGYAAAEFWYEHNREKSILEIAEIKPLPALQVRPVVPDGADDVEGIEIVGEEKEGPLDPETTIWFALDQYIDPKGWRPWGVSRYSHGGVEIWQARLELAEQRKQFTKRFALGQIVLYAPDEYPEGSGISAAGPLGQVDETGEPIDPKLDAAMSLQRTVSGGVAAFSSRNYPPEQGGGPLYRQEPITAQHQTAPIDTEETRTREDALSVIGIPPKSLYQENVGAFASVTAFQRIMYASALGFLDQLVTCYQTVIDRAWAMNYSTPCPLRATYQSLDPEVLYRIIEIAKAMVLSGQVSPLITEGVLDFPKMLDQAGIPVGDNLQERLAAVKAASAAAQPAMFRLRQRRKPMRRLAKPDPVKSLPVDWEKIGEEHAAEYAPILKQIYDILDRDPAAIDADTRRHL